MENSIKTLFVKQQHDLLGPRQSFKYPESQELGILKSFPGKVSLYEMLVYFKADFLICPTYVQSPWLQELLRKPGYREHLESTTTGVLDIYQADLSEYDLVITHDPILTNVQELKKRFPKTLFAYILAEHSSWQMHQIGIDYDLFLDHTLNSVDNIVRLPQAVNFLFPRVPKTIQSFFPEKNKSIFFDYRTLGYFISGGKNNVLLDFNSVNSYLDNISKDFPLPLERISKTSLQPFMFTKENENDSINYYGKLNRSKYFVSIANRIGQAAFDAASADSLVIGTDKSFLHNILCHKDCLVTGNFSEKDILNIIEKFESDPILYEKALKHQQNILSSLCIEHPKKVVLESLKLK